MVPECLSLLGLAYFLEAESLNSKEIFEKSLDFLRASLKFTEDMER
jgi:hypothetical protein